jgi:hypothetical protein
MSGADMITNGVPINLAAGQAVEMIVRPANLTLTIDTFDGSMSISNLYTGKNFEIDAYSITTASSTLLGDDANWFSLHDQAAAYPGWVEDVSEPNRLAESNESSSIVFSSGTSVQLGSPLRIDAAFAEDIVKDVTFEYKTVDGNVVQGVVEYINSRHNNLVLIVDPDTGEGLIQNQSAYDVEIDGYAITTQTAQMLSGAWNSLADQTIAGWQEANPYPNQLTELEPVSSSYIESGETLNLGTVWNVSGDGLLKYQFHLSGGETIEGIVEFLTEPDNLLKANFNGDEFVDILDLWILAENWLGNDKSQEEGDASGDGVVNLKDFAYLARYWLR